MTMNLNKIVLVSLDFTKLFCYAFPKDMQRLEWMIWRLVNEFTFSVSCGG